MLTELAEAEATGEIAEIFAEIRHLYATPYVSSIHRHLATRPGVLEWAWHSVAPVFRTGRAQELAWEAASRVSLPRLSPIPREALAIWGVGPEDLPKLKGIAQSFTRVSPINLVFGGLIADVLLGDAGGRGGTVEAQTVASRWEPPAAPLPPPPMIDPARAAKPEAELLALFRSGTGTTAFVPGLYRMLAHWPGLLAHFAVELGPLFNCPEKSAAAEKIIAGTRDIVAELAPMVAAPSGDPAPDGEEVRHLRRIIGGYRVTSPEMILFGRLIDEALPD